MISPNVTVICHSSPNNSNLIDISGFDEKYIKSGPVLIGDDVWVGAGTTMIPNVAIGNSSIIGQSSLVNYCVS